MGHQLFADGDIHHSLHTVGPLLDTVYRITHQRMGYGRDDCQELHILDRAHSQRPLEMVLQQFLGHLDDTHARRDGLSREMGLIDEVVSMKRQIIADG